LKLKKVFFPLLLTAIVFATAVLFPGTGQALTEYERITRELERVKRAKVEAQKQAATAQIKINEINREKNQVYADMDMLLSQIEQVGTQLAELQNQIEATEAEVLQAAAELQDAEERIAERDKLMKARLRLMYTNGFVSYLDVLLSATSFADFIDRYHALSSIVNQDKDILEENRKDREHIVVKKQEIEDKMREFEMLYAQEEEARQGLLVKEKEKEVLIASLNAEAEGLEEISEEQERMLMKLASAESELIKKQKSISFYQGGKLLYPLPKAYTLTSKFGIRIDPITGKKGVMHKGIDIGAPSGTDILAAEAGVVIRAEWWSTYGNVVIIDHGGGFWTLYAHIRPNGIKVKNGEEVKKGQKIAEVGNTGASKGNHLHFEVRKDTEPVDPMKYLK
jgi:murein DD-endopeptidase MepM/ murein hydrolase activator NlpD